MLNIIIDTILALFGSAGSILDVIAAVVGGSSAA